MDINTKVLMTVVNRGMKLGKLVKVGEEILWFMELRKNFLESNGQVE